MKTSKYNFIINYGAGKLLYNCRTERLAVLDDTLSELFENSSLDIVREKHPEFYAYLLENKFIVKDDLDETSDLIQEWEKEDNDNRTYSLFINPTMDCNLNCWYCYEKHIRGSVMNDKIFNSVVSLVRSKIKNTYLKQIHISFFGGEPLIAIDSIIVPLLTEVCSLCHAEGKAVSASFITNGTLLTQKNVDNLMKISMDSPYMFQIALDGNAQYHNKVKRLKNYTNTYELTMRNIKYLLHCEQDVMLRLNMTKENIDSYTDVITDLHVLSQKEEEHLTIDFQHVWQDNTGFDDDFLKNQKKIRQLFQHDGFIVKEMKHIDISRCYAERENCVTVNYNGDLFKCTAREFSKENREGNLLEDGSIVWNGRKELRDKIKYGNENCMACKIFPLCHGGCSQFKLENQNENDCIRNYSENNKNKIVEDRIEFLLEAYHQKINKKQN